MLLGDEGEDVLVELGLVVAVDAVRGTGVDLEGAVLDELGGRSAAAAIGTIWSSSPCARKIGTSSALRSSVKSVSENALTQSYAAARFTSIPWRQKSSRAPCDTFDPSRFAPKNGSERSW